VLFFPFKMRMMYLYRKRKLLAKGVQPTLMHLIFFRATLARAVSLQPLIASPDIDDATSSSRFRQGLLAPAPLDATQALILHQSHQIDAMLRLNADLHEKLQEQQEAILLLQQNNRPS